jgi:hypothetical protein
MFYTFLYYGFLFHVNTYVWGQLLSSVDKKNGLLGRELKKGFVPLQPQPDPASIVVVKRKYSTLSRHNAYKKRITWFECSLGLTNAVVEYIGYNVIRICFICLPPDFT